MTKGYEMTNQKATYAHIFGSKAKGFELLISKSADIRDAAKAGQYATKAEAKRAAQKFGATPYNY
jgi:hypothetical protein